MKDRLEAAMAYTIGGILGIGTAFLVSSSACVTSGTIDAGSPTCVIPPGSDGCVLPALARSVARNTTWDDALTFTAQACGVSKQAAETIWAAHTQAEVIEGFVPRAVGSDAGIVPSDR